MMGRISSPVQIRAITTVLNDNVRFNKEKERYADIKNVDFSLFRSLAQQIVDRILEIELKRGDSETQVTSLAEELSYIYGADTFIRILQAFGKDTFIRDSYNWGSTKRGVLSSLLHACHPLPTDTSENLKKLAKQAEISNERLVEAAMFAPQWIELTEKAIGWKGLTSAAYYFHAHTNETCDDKKKQSSPATPLSMWKTCGKVLLISTGSGMHLRPLANDASKWSTMPPNISHPAIAIPVPASLPMPPTAR